jgi:mRNA interferase RelE/StbE
MEYQVEIKPRAVKDLKGLPLKDARQILEKVEAMQQDLAGDVKRLTNHTPEYRLRVGDYRVLFEVAGENVIIYRIRHRKDAYQ